MSTATPAETALIEENRRLYSRIAELERERQIPSEIIEKSPVMISIVRAPDFVYEFVNPAFQALAPGKEFLGRRFADAWSEVPGPLVENLQNIIATGQTLHLEDAPYTIQRGPGMPPEVVYVSYSWIPLFDPEGKPDRVLTLAHEVTGAVRQRLQLADSITELRRAEKALRESEERFRVAQELSPDGFLIFRPLRDDTGAVTDFLWIYENDAAARMNDTNPKEVCGKRLSEVLPHHDESPFHRAYKEVAETGEVRIVEDAFYDQDTFQQRRWFRVAVVPTSGGNVAVLVQNETKRKRAEEAIAAAQRQIQSIIDNTSAIVYAFDLEERFVLANSALAELLNSTPQKMIGKRRHEFMPKEDADWHEANYRQAIQAGSALEFEEYSQLKGRSITWLTTKFPLRDAQGRINAVAGISADISERKKAESELKKHAELLRLSFDPMIVWRLDGAIEGWNLGAERLYGYSEQEARGRVTHELLATVFPKPWPDILTGLRTTGSWEGELRHRTRDGRQVMVSTRLQLIEGSDRIERVLEVNRDITEKKQAEEQLRQTQKLESLGLLAGGVAHDFNNLLVGVIGNASLAQEMLPPDHPVADLLAEVLKTGEQAAHLTRQMLAYSGKGKFLVEPLNLSALIPDMCGLVRPSISKKIELRLDLEKDLPQVEADRGQVQQVFMNLALNAAEAIGSEGLITVRTGLQDVDELYLRLHPELAALAPGKYVCLEVRDTGSGMDEATKAKIFDPFFSTKFTGRGLGLAAVSGILRGHRSGITVSSAPGQGSCFTVLFPVTMRAAGNGPVGGRDASLRGAGTVLVVDDEQVVRELAKRALERHGYTVLLADGGTTAIDVFKRHPGEIALVVLDLSMPRMSGEEALPELRKIRPEVKVVVSSGYSESEAMPLFDGQRVSGFVQKPYTSKAIAEKVKDCLG